MPTVWTQGTKKPSPRASSTGGAHARHDPHRDRDIGRVGHLHADVGDRRAERAHAEGDDIHGSSAHAAVEKISQGLLHGNGINPVVGRPRVVIAPATDECSVLDPGHVSRVRESQVAVRSFFGVEPPEGPLLHEQLAQPVVFLLRAVAPDDFVGPTQLRHLINPRPELRQLQAHSRQDSGHHRRDPGHHRLPPHAQIRKSGALRSTNLMGRRPLPRKNPLLNPARPEALVRESPTWTHLGKEHPPPRQPASGGCVMHAVISGRPPQMYRDAS